MRKHITPSVVISLIALTLSVMGAGYAAITLPRDSVGRAQIKSGAVGSLEVANGSLKPADFSKAALAKLTGAAGPKGDAGARGEAGPAGAAGTGGSGGGTGLNVIGGDGTVVGTFVESNTGMLTVRLPNGMLTRYATGFSDGTRRAGGPGVYSLNADCSEPRYTLPNELSSVLGGAMVYYAQGLDWAFTIGTQRISPTGDPMLYGVQGAPPCTQLNNLSWYNDPSGEMVKLEPAAVPPVLHTPVTLG
jgi:hypothetical protein